MDTLSVMSKRALIQIYNRGELSISQLKIALDTEHRKGKGKSKKEDGYPATQLESELASLIAADLCLKHGNKYSCTSTGYGSARRLIIEATQAAEKLKKHNEAQAQLKSIMAAIAEHEQHILPEEMLVKCHQLAHITRPSSSPYQMTI